jgi:hypothetical protein
MSADLHAVQAAIILTTAMILAGGHGAMNAAIGFFHNDISFRRIDRFGQG